MRQEKTKKPVGNFILAENPMCELKPMANSDKAFMWPCMDFSDGEEGVLDKLAARFQNAEAANEFKAAMEAGQKFNADAKAGKDLVYADEVEDVEAAEEDDIDTNKTADADGE